MTPFCGRAPALVTATRSACFSSATPGRSTTTASAASGARTRLKISSLDRLPRGMATTRQATSEGQRAPVALWDRYQRSSQPPAYRTSLRGGARRVSSRARSRASRTRATSGSTTGADGPLPRAAGTAPASRAGGVRALRLVRPQLRGRGSRSADSGRNRALSPLTCPCPSCGNSTPVSDMKRTGCKRSRKPSNDERRLCDPALSRTAARPTRSAPRAPHL